MERHGQQQPPTAANLIQDQLKVLFDSPLGVALRQHLWDLLEEEVQRLHATGSRSAAHTAGGVMAAQRIVLPEKRDDWAPDSDE